MIWLLIIACAAMLGMLVQQSVEAGLLGVALILMAFPGRDPARPRLIRVLPWLWGLNLVAAAAILVLRSGSAGSLPEEIRELSDFDLWSTLLLSPLLLGTFFYAKRAFKPAAVVSAVVSSAAYLSDYFDGARGLGEGIRATSSVGFEIAITAYLLARFRVDSPKRVSKNGSPPSIA
jgi:hypothetical protein